MSLYPKNLKEYFALAMASIPRSKGSKVFLVDYVNGSDSNTGTSFESPLKTVEAAYALCTTLKNDVVLLVGNGTSNVAAAAITWAKDYTHLIGLNSGGPEPRSRIKPTAALATTPFVTWSASGCIVKNISFYHETSDAAGLVNVSVTGERNTFDGCQFAGGAGANAATGARSLKVAGSGNTFKNSVIGLDTVGSVNGMAGVEFDAGAMHTSFLDCEFITSTNGTTYAHATVPAAADVGRYNVFKKCIFINEGSGAQAEAIIIAAALPVASYLYLIDCWMYGTPEWNLTNNGLVMNSTIAANTTGVATGNLMVKTS